MDRRYFLKGTATGLVSAAAGKAVGATSPQEHDEALAEAGPEAAGEATIRFKPGEVLGDPRDSGIFGHWVSDEFGLPAFRYEIDHLRDPRATWDTLEFGKTNRHWHQLGNDRVTAIASNEGWIQVYSHEFGPRWINMYRPDQQSYAGGVSLLQADGRMLATLYRCLPPEAKVERLWGCSYITFTVEHGGLRLERTVFAPFGDSPFLVARVRVTNLGASAQKVTHTEYWDLHLHNIDYDRTLPWYPNQRNRDLISARLYSGYTCEWDEKLGALVARHPWGVVTCEKALNWPNPTVNNRPDVSLKPLGFKPSRLVTDRSSLFDEVGRYLPNFQESSTAPAGLIQVLPPEMVALLSAGSGKPGEAPILAASSEHTLAPGESLTLGYAYGATPSNETADELHALVPSAEELFPASMQAWKKYVPSVEVGNPSLSRELAWSAYYVRSGAVYHRGFNAHTLPQGGAYQYLCGCNAGPRATLQHALSLIWLAPELAKDVIRFTLAQTHPSGEVPYAEVGSGLLETCEFIPSDNDLWLLWTVSEYVLSTRDREFLSEVCSYWPPPYSRPEPVWDHCIRAFCHLTEDIGYGPHGLLRMRTSDWNDGIIAEGKVPMDRVWAEGESTLNTAMAVHVLRRFAELARYAHQPAMESRARQHAAKLAQAAQSCWRGRHLNRGWRDRNHEFGFKDLYLEPQPWALISGVLDKEQQAVLVDEITRRLADPLGSRIFGAGGEGNPPTAFGGVWLSINSTLVWGLSKVSPERAWKELIANTLFNHARTYPSVWLGTWSGPDCYLPSNSERPGETWIFPHYFGLQNWPIQILFPHSEILNGTLWSLGIEASAEGISVRPRVPFERWSWSGPGLSIRYDETVIQGSISGVGPELITLELQLPPAWEGGSVEIEPSHTKRSKERAGKSVRLSVCITSNTQAEFAVKKA
jgi:Glycosyl hydrolase 36 superfamily, catalytic domain/Glycosyltransferase family 36